MRAEPRKPDVDWSLASFTEDFHQTICRCGRRLNVVDQVGQGTQGRTGHTKRCQGQNEAVDIKTAIDDLTLGNPRQNQDRDHGEGFHQRT